MVIAHSLWVSQTPSGDLFYCGSQIRQKQEPRGQYSLTLMGLHLIYRMQATDIRIS